MVSATDLAKKDLAKAKQTREKKIARDAAKAVSEVARSGRAQAKAKAKALAAQDAATLPRTSARAGPTFAVFDAPMAFTDMRVLDADAIGESVDGSEPYIVRTLPQVVELLKEDPVQASVNLFVPLFPETPMAKARGRVQKCFGPVHKIPECRTALLQATPFVDVMLPEGTVAYTHPELQSLRSVSLFGFVASMMYKGVEFDALGQLRYMIQGKRFVLAAPFPEVNKAFQSENNDLSKPEVIAKFANFKPAEKGPDDLLPADFPQGLKVFKGEHIAGQAMYVPPGWVVVEKVLGGAHAHGLRTSAMTKKHMGHFEAHHEFMLAKDAGKVNVATQLSDAVIHFVNHDSVKTVEAPEPKAAPPLASSASAA